MNLSVNASGAWQHTLDIEIPAEEVEAGLDDVARNIQRRAALAGFRRGKVPLPMVRQHYAEVVEREFLEAFVPKVTGKAVGEAKLDPVVPPLVRNLDFGPGRPMKFQAVVEVRPEVQVRDYKDIPVTRRTRVVDDAAVEAMVERLRADAAIFLDLARPAQRGDVVIADSVRLDAKDQKMPSTRARNLRLELGAPDMMPDLENGLLGAEPGQERTVEIHYPQDHPTQELAGRQIRYRVRVKKIQEKKLRDLDDNFAREVFGLGSFADLQARVRANLETEEATRTRREVEEGIAEELIRRNPIELPQRLTQWTVDRMIQEAVQGRSIDEALHRQLDERYRPAVERSLKREILLGAVARQESIAVSDDEVAAEIERMVQADPRQAARVRARYQSAERRRGLAEAVLERKALDWLIGAAKVTEEAIGGRVVPAGA